MNKARSLICGLCILSAGTYSSDAAVITISPDDITYFGFQTMANWFDAQPATEPTEGTSTDDFGAGADAYPNDGRGFAIDFGPDYAQISVEKVYVGLKQFGTNPTPFTSPDVFWSDTNANNTFEPGEGDSAAPDFGLFSWEAITGDKSWQLIYDGPAVTPAAQYYVWRFDGTGGSGNRFQEVVFVGQVPEPSTALAVLFGAGTLLIRRRRVRR